MASKVSGICTCSFFSCDFQLKVATSRAASGNRTHTYTMARYQATTTSWPHRTSVTRVGFEPTSSALKGRYPSGRRTGRLSSSSDATENRTRIFSVTGRHVDHYTIAPIQIQILQTKKGWTQFGILSLPESSLLWLLSLLTQAGCPALSLMNIRAAAWPDYPLQYHAPSLEHVCNEGRRSVRPFASICVVLLF